MKIGTRHKPTPTLRSRRSCPRNPQHAGHASLCSRRTFTGRAPISSSPPPIICAEASAAAPAAATALTNNPKPARYCHAFRLNPWNSTTQSSDASSETSQSLLPRGRLPLKRLSPLPSPQTRRCVILSTMLRVDLPSPPLSLPPIIPLRSPWPPSARLPGTVPPSEPVAET